MAMRSSSHSTGPPPDPRATSSSPLCAIASGTTSFICARPQVMAGG